MKKFIFMTVILFPLLAAAQGDNVKFPIAELGNCGSKAECKTYCDEPVNEAACLSFAEKNNLMSKEELALARKMSSGEIKGPGGCTSRENCEAYCDNLSRIEECVSFAEANNLIPPEELKEIQGIRNAIKQGVQLPACNNKRECDSYCREPANMEVCINFALKAGLMPENERVEAEKILGALQKGFKPPACAGEKDCEQYCSKEENFKECSDFARAAGMLSEEEFEEISEGSKNCRESLIKAPEEVKNCITARLGKDESQISPGPASGAALRECYEKYKPEGDEQYGPGDPGAERENRRSGPGGCQNREECDAYCRSNPNECRPQGMEAFREGTPPPEYERDGSREQFLPPEEGTMPPPNFEKESGEAGESPFVMPGSEETRQEAAPAESPDPASLPSSDSAPTSSIPKLLQAALVLFGIK